MVYMEKWKKLIQDVEAFDVEEKSNARMTYARKRWRIQGRWCVWKTEKKDVKIVWEKGDNNKIWNGHILLLDGNNIDKKKWKMLTQNI